MQHEPLPDVSWDPREPETRSEHHPRGLLREIARSRRIEATSESRIPASKPTEG